MNLHTSASILAAVCLISAILALTGPPSLAVLWGVMITEKWPWEK